MRNISKFVILFASTFPCIAFSAEGSKLTKNLHCEQFTQAREQEICRGIEKNLQFTWTGHASIAPGTKYDLTTAQRVFCEQHITSQDIALLKNWQFNAPDWRISSVADILLRGLGDTGAMTAYKPQDITSQCAK